MRHDGDIFSNLANGWVASPSSGPTGSLGFMSRLASVLAFHVNQVSHANPHGLAAADIGAATTSYVDASSASAIATVNNEFSSTLSASGFQRFANGMILQWIAGNIDNSSATLTQSGNWPVNFPNGIIQTFVSTTWVSNGGGTDSDIMIYQLVSQSNSGWTVRRARGGQYAQAEQTFPVLLAIGF
jgi:hypothetical protein